ncbi:MAG: HAD family phosphatase [Candidatus Bilamarchaeaceae archaeon]
MEIGFLFDFDGVVVESEPLHLETFREIVKPLGIEISDERWYREFVGVGSPHIMKTLLGEIGIKDENIIKKYVDERRDLFQKRILEGKLQLKEGIEKFLQEVKKRNIKTAIVSGGHKENIKVALSILKLDNYFDIVVGREDYEKRKPDPECYLVAAKKLNISPTDCIAFEDSLSGCLAAKAAKMKVVALEAPFDVEKGGCKTDLKIKNFVNKKVDFFIKLLK